MRVVGLFIAIVRALALVAAAQDDGGKSVRDVLERRCVSCHNAKDKKGGLSLATRQDLLAGGDSGPVILPGKPAESLLLDAVSGEKPEMPKNGPPLTEEQVAAIRTWIASGANWPADLVLTDRSRGDANWWSLQPLVRPPVPIIRNPQSEIRNPIDAFIVAKLDQQRLPQSPEADRRTLIRRVYFDLVGLPPQPEEIAAFLADPDPQAYQRLVDRLLASPQYGERWARHWLDVVHYGETHGYDKDKPRPNAWPYRDYVVRSLNGDKPYGRFVQEQIAGDVLHPGTADGVEALGFLAAGPWDFIGHVELPETKIDGKVARHLDRDDMAQNVSGTLLSLTVGCAQCHDHKFDPISQREYYQLQAVFAALDRNDKPYDPDPAIGERRRELTAELARLTAERKAFEERAAKKDDSGANMLNGVSAAIAQIEQSLKSLPPQQVVYAGTAFRGEGNFQGTGGRPRPIFILNRGNVTQPGEEVEPGTLACISLAGTKPGPGSPRIAANAASPEASLLPAKGGEEGDRRAALARWITDERNPLPWRSIANRLWQYHFGRGIVDTPSDFGRMGALPTHPELLDWLAAELRDRGQSLKDLHRLIVTSHTYRQSSSAERRAGGAERSDETTASPRSALRTPSSIDSDNRYLWHANRRRLEAEAVRDAVLLLAGRLDARMGGPSFQDFVIEHPEHSPHYEYQLHDPDDPRSHRRSIYRFLVRSQPQPFMATLDCADPSQRVDKRSESLSALQALATLNNGFMLVMSRHWAEKLEIECGDLSAQVDRAVQESLGRAATAEERALLAEYAREHGLANLCRVLLNSNEFAFVD